MELYIALIGGLCTAIPTIITTILSNNKNKTLLTYRIDQLEIEQKKHNNLIDRMYKVENRVTLLEDEMKGVRKND